MSIRSLLEYVGAIRPGQRIFVGDREVDPPMTISEISDRDLAAQAEPTEARRERRMEEIADRYTYHPPTEDQIRKYTSLRTRVKELAFLIEEVCPDSEEKGAAFASLDLTLMNANASIARHS